MNCRACTEATVVAAESSGEEKKLSGEMEVSTDYWRGSEHGGGSACTRQSCVLDRARYEGQVAALQKQLAEEREQHSRYTGPMAAGEDPSTLTRLLQARIHAEAENAQRLANQVRAMEQEKASREGELLAAARTAQRLQAERADLERRLHEETKSHRTLRNNYTALQREQQARQVGYNANPVPVQNNLIRDQNWVPGCEKYGIGVDEVG